jgi:hypothetical protein
VLFFSRLPPLDPGTEKLHTEFKSLRYSDPRDLTTKIIPNLYPFQLFSSTDRCVTLKAVTALATYGPIF